MLDVVIPAPTEEEIKRAFKLKTEQNQITVAIAGAIAQAFWFVCDYVLIPESRLQFLVLRLLVLVIPIALCLYRHKLKLSGSFCLFFAGVMVSTMIATVVCSVNEAIFPTYVFGYAILFIGVGALANWDRKYSVLFPVISLLINSVLYIALSPMELNKFIAEGMFPIFSCAIIGSLMIENRRAMQLKEIRSRMEIDRSRKLIEAQKNKLNEELDNFVYSVSHDLRSPLLSVKGILTLLEESGKIDKSAEQYLRMAESSIDRLDNTIQDILEYSRNSRIDVKREWFDIGEVVKQIFDDIQFISETPLRFEINVEGSSTIFSDKTRIATIIKNLASNAAKYRKLDVEDSYVKFHMRPDNDQLLLSVSDNGIGIPENQKDHVFKMFYRISSDRVGTGLGLFIVQEITLKLNGRITLESEVEQGTRITIALPIASDQSGH